ncbi:MAG: HD domain-containing protein [Chloroflexi bacterium]|nr:HD domain-containing protein [Chloroflexota bacterium]
MFSDSDMNALKQALLQEMEAYFGEDARRIKHARRVTQYAEELFEKEGGDYLTVIGAAVLHDIGIHMAEKKYGSAGGKYQEKEGPPIAWNILAGLSLEPERIEEICQIIAHHHSPGKINTLNFKILYDADWLVNLADEYDIKDTHKLTSIIEKVFLTESGKAMARQLYLEDNRTAGRE